MSYALPQDEKAPGFLLTEGVREPRASDRRFHNKLYPGWEGFIRLDDLTSWLDNPRLDIPIQQFQATHSRLPTDPELLQIVLDYSANQVGESRDPKTVADEDEDEKRNKFMLLAKSIGLNGVREPLIITSKRKLLDGNRRFLACLFLRKTAPDGADNSNFDIVKVWVLPSVATTDDEDAVVTEMNFIDDGRDLWPYSVRARHVYRDYVDNKLSVDDLAKKYHTWAKSRIRAVIEASRVAEQFKEHHGAERLEADDLAYRHLIWFDELARNNRKQLEKEQFRSAVFDMLLEEGPDGQSRFRRSRDFVRLGEIYDDPKAWETLINTQGREAVQKAEFVLDQKRFEDRSDADERMQRVNELLIGLEASGSFERVEKSTLAEYHRLALRVPGAPVDASSRIARIVDWLAALTSEEVADLPVDVVAALEVSLDRVAKQARATAAAA